jgi:hypothetical protein
MAVDPPEREERERRERGEVPGAGRWVYHVPDWVGHQFYRHGLFCASQVLH